MADERPTKTDYDTHLDKLEPMDRNCCEGCAGIWDAITWLMFMQPVVSNRSYLEQVAEEFDVSAPEALWCYVKQTYNQHTREEQEEVYYKSAEILTGEI